MSIQQFCLRWNNHQPNFISVFTTLLNSESLVDVTLAAEGRHLQAHRVVLSACSSYFQSLFTVNPCQHPIVILKDVKYNDLKIMVDFMYYGEVNVSQEQLPAILKTAEMLKIKGLAEMPENNMSGSVHMLKSQSSSSDKAELLVPGESAWGPEVPRRSPSPMSPSMRRKRLRKSSTGSGSGSTERTSEEMSGEVTLVSSPVVKPEPVPFTPDGENSGHNEGALRNSTQEPSTESEPREGSQDSVEEDPMAMQMSHESNSAPVENPIPDTGPGPSTSQQPVTTQGVWVKNLDILQDLSLRASVQNWFSPVTFPMPNYSGFSVPSSSPRAKLVETTQGKKLIVCNKEVPRNMLRAIRAVILHNYSINKAAMMYKVSQSTLWRYVGLLPMCVEEKELRDFVTYDVPTACVSSSKPGKRGRPLIRQPRIKKEIDPVHTSPDSEPGSPPFATSGTLLSVPNVRVERASTEPPLTTSTSTPNLLTVPQPAYLVKQHSDPLLPTHQSSSGTPSSTLLVQRQLSQPSPSQTCLVPAPSFHVHLVTDSSHQQPPSKPSEHSVRAISPSVVIEPLPVLRVITDQGTDVGKATSSGLRIRTEELRRTASSPQASSPREKFEPMRSGHCPVLRPGPALGCNFCWNTIDGHGRILRRKTKYHCPECQTNLCIVPCFQEYHEKHNTSDNKETARPISPNSMKILPKTSSI